MNANRLQPAFWAGLFIGVLSSLPFVNCCCCLWVIGGGALAVYLRQQNMPAQIEASEGALVGLLAGVIGGLFAAILTVLIAPVIAPFNARMLDWAMSMNPNMPAEMQDRMTEIAAAQRAFSIAKAILAIFIDAIFGLLGGLLGVALFKKNAPPPPPPGTVEVSLPGNSES